MRFTQFLCSLDCDFFFLFLPTTIKVCDDGGVLVFQRSEIGPFFVRIRDSDSAKCPAGTVPHAVNRFVTGYGCFAPEKIRFFRWPG